MKLNTLNPIFQDPLSKHKIVHKKVLCIECKTHIKHEVLVDISEYDETHSPIDFHLNYRILKIVYSKYSTSQRTVKRRSTIMQNKDCMYAADQSSPFEQ